MSLNIKIGNYLKHFRLQNGLAIEDVAHHFETITVDQLQQIEAGEKQVALNQLYSLANIYGITPDELVAFLFESATSSDQESQAKIG